jgi:hypothetical protein
MAPSVVARLIDALEPRLEDFKSPDGAQPVELVSFPFAECAGLFTNALERLESAEAGRAQ